MNKIIVFTTGLIICLILVFPLSLTFLIKNISNQIQPSLDSRFDIYDTQPVIQYVLITEDNFSGIALSIANPNLANKKDLNVTILSADDQVLRETKISGANIGDGAYPKILFAPITDSKNQTYKIKFSTPDTSIAEAKLRQSLGLYLTYQKVPWLKQIFIATEPEESRTVALITFSRPKTPFFLMSQVISSLWQRFLADPIFSLFYLVLISSLVGFLITSVSKSGSLNFDKLK